jgi:hypothetical protein
MMKELPIERDLDFLVGSTLLQVCIGENELILRFDEEISITIESKFLVRDSNGLETAFDSSRSAAASLVKLLSDTVKNVLGQSDGTLRLWFTRGDILEIFDSSEGYESY